MERRLIKLEGRNLKPKHSVKVLREQGYVPGILYGKSIGNLPVRVARKDLSKLGGSQMVEVELGRAMSYSAVIREIQKEPLTGLIKHVDFQQIEPDEKIMTAVPLQFIGEPRGLEEGGIVQWGERIVEIEALPQDIPEFLEVDISSLDIGDKITVADLLKITPLHISSDVDSVLVQVTAPKMLEEQPEHPVEVTEEERAADKVLAEKENAPT